MRGKDPAGKNAVACVVLAGGLGKRMKSPLPKVLHPLLGSPMIFYALDAALSLNPVKTIVVTGKFHNEIERSLAPYGGRVDFAIQEKPLGTANALLQAARRLKGFFFNGSTIVLNGDSPLMTPGTLKRLVSLHRKNGNSLSLGSFITDEPGAYGRILRDGKGSPVGIVEKSDLSGEQIEIREVNSGLYVLEPQALALLDEIPMNPNKKEYYLTDILRLAMTRGMKAGVYPLATEEEFAGINNPLELRQAELVLRKRQTEGLVKKGVRLMEPALVFIESGVKIAPGAVIYPNVHLQGRTVIGKGCIIYPNVRIIDSVLREGAVVKDSSVIENSTIGKNAQIGPFAHLRPGAVINPSAKIGNFVEIKNSEIGAGTKAMHLSYIGDASVGRKVNIGAGTITCNYDGVNKNRTVIEDGVFIGSDSQLIAPVSVKKGAYVAAGSTINRDVPPGSLAISRTEQKNLSGWVKNRKRKQAHEDKPAHGKKGR
ncbi:MAG: bifunctional UDP-N-acetylglucosamine diphosphorylase/glucosamine-1-phosphate N-acetyltransferase GlmU [Nitrospiraceae bacterium]|nr:bifunctional UDP-N-acetylglucosamine diphosphorylase/glucosamine-1-phosphate N-acetyltransferase GlmU [Nitrospiraceae bacterium]